MGPGGVVGRGALPLDWIVGCALVTVPLPTTFQATLTPVTPARLPVIAPPLESWNTAETVEVALGAM